MNLIEYSKKNGMPITTGRVRMVSFDGAMLHVLTRGMANLFCVPFVDGKPFGQRTYVGSVSAGQLLFPVPLFERGKSSLGLVVDVGPDQELSALDVSIEELARRLGSAYVAERVDEWLTLLLHSLDETSVAPDCRQLDATEKVVAVSKGESFRAGQGIVWTHVQSGFGLLGGREEGAPVIEGAYIALSTRTWVQCLDEMSLQVGNTQELLDGGDFGVALHSFHHWFFTYYAMETIFVNERRRNLWAQHRAMEDRAVAGSCEALIGLIDAEDKVADLPQEALADSLHTVCAFLARRNGFSFSYTSPLPDGTSTEDQLVALLEQTMVYYRKVALKGRWWKCESLDTVVFNAADGKPYAVVYDQDRKQTILFDPANEAQRPVTAERARELAPYGYTLYRSFPEGKLTLRNLLKFSIQDVRRAITAIIALGILGGLLSLVTPVATGMVFNKVIPDGNTLQLFQIGAILLSLTISTMLFGLVKSLALLRVFSLGGYHLQAAVWSRVLQLPSLFFNQYTAGDLADRTMAVNQIRQIFSEHMSSAILALLFSLPNLLLMFYYSWKLSLVSLALLLVFGVILFLFGWMEYRIKRILLEEKGVLAGFELQLFTGIAKIRTSISENRAFVKWAQRYRNLVQLELHGQRLGNGLNAITGLFSAAATFCFFYLVGSVWRSGFNIGSYVAFNSAYSSVSATAMQLATMIPGLMIVGPLYKRMRPVFDSVLETASGARMPSELSGAIELDNVSFRYQEDGPLILDACTLRCEPGELVAIAGPSGAGKSTIARLLLGLEDPASGCVLFGGQDVSQMNKRALRSQIGCVLQNSSVFQGSIFENIVGTNNLTMDDAWDAARRAGFDRDVQEMPMGMQTFVFEGGLSGGQKQRLLIARAMVKKPRIIIFDEATSALDNTTQAVVSESLRMLNATRVVIAHRLSTIVHADRIYVMDQGRVVQQGSYDELMEESGLFKRMAARQLI